MNTTSTHFVPPRGVGMYEQIYQIGDPPIWGEAFRGFGNPNASGSMLLEVNPKQDSQSDETSHGTPRTSNYYEQEATMARHKAQRRLAQNREAARKSRLRKKAYIQQLETSRKKLIQLEQELERARQQGFHVGNGVDTGSLGIPGAMNSGIAMFEMGYGRWVEEQNRQICELKTALNAHRSEAELRILVETGMNHYIELFRMKSVAAKADVFYVMSGMWKTPAERFFLWIGGFRPSELLKVLLPHFHPLADQQLLDVYSLTQACQQAEDALSQGMEKLQHNLAQEVADGRFNDGNVVQHMNSAMDKLHALVSFVNQADHLRLEALQQMYRILTAHQAGRALVVLGEYFQSLRDLTTLWSTRPHESKLPT